MALNPAATDPNRKSEQQRKQAEPDAFNQRKDETSGESVSKPRRGKQ